MNEKKEFNFEPALSSIEKVKEMKAKYETKQSTSIKPLKFDINEKEDSPLKILLLEKLNSRNLTYADLHKYCTQIMGGDISAGKNLGYNLINGLKKRHAMVDTTFHILCDFLNLDIILKERETDSGEEDDED